MLILKNINLSLSEKTNSKNVKEMMDEINKNYPRTIIVDPKAEYKNER
ncbi:hypothetical protein [Lactococcus lactis]|nr:hypothetical protein [Lactococcus lactis]